MATFLEIVFTGGVLRESNAFKRSFVLPWSRRAQFAHDLFARSDFIPHAQGEPLSLSFGRIDKVADADTFRDHITELSRIYGDTEFALATVTYLLVDEPEPATTS